jgi:predicted kinase
MKRLILTIGLPGSGKSTWARAQEGFVIVERDQIREELTGDAQDHTREPAVTRLADQRVRDALMAGTSVIVADTNLRGRYRNGWQHIAVECGAEYEEVSFLDVSVETCIERDALRARPVGEEVIRKMAQFANPPQKR